VSHDRDCIRIQIPAGLRTVTPLDGSLRAIAKLMGRELRLMMIRCARSRHDYGMALYLLPLLLAILLSPGCNRNGVSDYLTAGDEAMQNTRLAEAESNYQQAAKVAPNDARPHLALGSLYIFEHKAPQAINELMKALELEPGNAKAHAMLANAYSAQSELGLAEAQERAAVALDPARAEYRMSLGNTLKDERKLGAAEAEYRTAIGLEPRNAHAHLALAALLNSEPNRNDEAQAEYAQVKALDPSLLPATAVATAAPPAAANTPAASIAPIVPESTLKQIDKRFLLTHDSPVYESMNDNARIIAQVHQRRYVHVTGLGAQWLRIQLRNGTIGFIPVTAAE
jgi:tetratricopeptide (TPR) repeat protein